MNHFLRIRLLGVLLLGSIGSRIGYTQAPPTQPGGNVTVRNLREVNSDRLDFSPAFYQNGLVYVSSRQHSGPKDKKIAESFFELFYTELDDAGNPLRPEPFSVSLNSQKHEGPVTFNRDGDVLYFTRNNMANGVGKSNAAGVSHLKIYEARKGAYDWGVPEALPFSSDDYTVAHPSLSQDGQRLYFTSDMPGGAGGMDLYVAERTADGWSAPRNLGASINTPGNDVFPFIHSSGHLVFSSNGRPGLGGLDLFYCLPNVEEAPVHLGAPFNSAADDLSLILDEAGRIGYFASSREGGIGQDDLYSFVSEAPLFGQKPMPPVMMALTARSAASTEPIAAVDLRLFEMDDNGLLRGDDLYTVALNATSDDVGNTLELRRKDVDDLGPAPFQTNELGVDTLSLQPGLRYLLIATHPEFEPTEQLIDLRESNTTEALSLQLARRTCRTVSGQLLDRSTNNILADQPIALLLEADNFMLLRTDSTGLWTACLEPDGFVTATVTAPGYAELDLQFDPTNLPPAGLRVALRPAPNAPTEASGLVRKPNPVLAGTELSEGTVLVLEQIYYEFNKSAIRAGAAEELDALLTLLRRYPSMHIELTAHTDARGTAKYNKTLSQRRATSAKQYLVSKGISPQRIAARGAGESRLRNRCTTNSDCTEEEHAFNRRMEVRVTQLRAEVEEIGGR